MILECIVRTKGLFYCSLTTFSFSTCSKRLLALATQKFVADIATDAFQYCKVRQSGSKKAGKVRSLSTTEY